MLAAVLDYLYYGYFNFWGLGVLFQVLMVVHFIRNRPAFYWLFVIFFFGPIGAAVYFFVEVAPGMRWKLPAIERWERRRRKQWYEKLVRESPSQEALGQLAAIYALEGSHARAIKLYGDALDRDEGDLEGRYGRALSSIELRQYQDAIDDLKVIVDEEPHYKMHQAQIALARCYETVDRQQDAATVYRSILDRNPISAANYGLGKILADQGETAQARQLMEEVISKQTGLPRHLRRQERPWVRRAKKLLRRLPSA
jgi:hypothetical protein